MHFAREKQQQQKKKNIKIVKLNDEKLRLLFKVVFVVCQFQRHIKKSEGQKAPKVELQISIYGVKILDPKTKVSHSVSQHN